ncbi:2'-5' RNA ligase family protein [Streptococcus sp. S784/96/1]|uniref:2'-5' RNA ligase family protein n=1 Tax=Streptococcus sp. S784/96/1 TaxID=2653499 RepID=UPI0013871354|nr:2'-5' RNA ligase family protein [Streptococcus sp. S784/96/1]
MFMYAIIATLDDQSNEMIREAWYQLKELSLSDYAYEVSDREPHITLASFEVDDIDSVTNTLDSQLDAVLPIEISFQSLGSFLGSRIVFLSPTKTPDLISLHNQIHELLKGIIAPDSQYASANWIPHVTIANRIDEEKVEKVYSYCLNHLKVTKAHIAALKLIAISDDKEVSTICEYS